MTLPAARIAFFLFAAIAQADAVDGAVTRLFIFSGQSNMKHLEPDQSFSPVIKRAFSKDEMIVVKHAISGQSISRWHAGWKSASGEPSRNTGRVICMRRSWA